MGRGFKSLLRYHPFQELNYHFGFCAIGLCRASAKTLQEHRLAPPSLFLHLCHRLSHLPQPAMSVTSRRLRVGVMERIANQRQIA